MNNANSKIKEYFSQNRIQWNQFYPSERAVIEKIWPASESVTVLDIGCGCAGLFLALEEKFGNEMIKYTGMEIDKEAVKYATDYFGERIRIVNTDFDAYERNNTDRYNVVFSLGCFDWNTNLKVNPLDSFYSMFRKSWQMVENGGFIIISLRLDIHQTLMDLSKSYQYINYNGEKDGDIANYSVINIEDCATLFKQSGLYSVTGNGYYGKPGSTAVTPFEQVCFAVFALQKREGFFGTPQLDITFPEDIHESFKTYFIETK